MNVLESLAGILGDMSGRELRLLSAVIAQEEGTRRHGFSFFQKVYLRIQGMAGSNYLSNFVTARVLSADKEWVRCVSESGKTVIQVINDPESTSLYTVARFEPLRTQMFKLKKFKDPQLSIKLNSNPSYRAVATLDEADKAGALETPIAKRRLPRSTVKDDLVALAAKISRGHFGKSKKPHTTETVIFDYRT